MLTAASALVLTLSISGHGFEYFWPERAVPWWLDRLALLAIWGICVIRFSQNLLQSRQHARWAHHLLNACCLLFLPAWRSTPPAGAGRRPACWR